MEIYTIVQKRKRKAKIATNQTQMTQPGVLYGRESANTTVEGVSVRE